MNAPLPSGPLSTRHLIIGQRMRALREAAGVSPKQAANLLRTVPERISNMEYGRASFSHRDHQKLTELYGTADEEFQAVMKLIRGQENVPGWWAAYSDILPDWVEPYFSLEEQASSIYVWEMQFVPGLLQTDEYMRGVMGLGQAEGPDLSRRAEARMLRQEILLRDRPPRFTAVIDEAALRRPPVRPDVMREQIRELLKMCEHPAVTVRVMRFGEVAGATNAFTILRFDQPGPRDIVYIEHYTGAAYLDGRAEIDAYSRAMNDNLNRAAPEEETPEILRGILEEM